MKYQFVIRTTNSKGQYTKSGIQIRGEISENRDYLQKLVDDWNEKRKEIYTLKYENGLYCDPMLKADVKQINGESLWYTV